MTSNSESALFELAAQRLPHATASELVQALARRELTASALCEAAIARIEQLDGAINAVVVRDFERAREQASSADRALERGERRPLLGLPMTVKESFHVAGLPTTWGLSEFREHRAKEDAVCVQRLKQAGAVILGKTNVSVHLADWQAINPVYGRTQHPLDATRTPGGSSGGSAAAVASGMVPLELGSDIGGSIRVPASFCGIYGHNPTFGLVPARGHAAGDSDGAAAALGVAGPLARSADDLKLALSVLAGPDGDEALAYRLELPPARVQRLADARLLILSEHPSAVTAPELSDAVQALAGDLERAGARVSRNASELPDLAAAHRLYVKMLGTITGRSLPPSPRTLSAPAWLDLIDARERLRRQWRSLFRSYDAVIAPAFGTFAYEHVAESVSWPERTMRIADRDTPYGALLAWPGVATFPGLPSTAIPIAATSTGLPLGAQVIGPFLEDLTPIAIASAIAQLRSS